MTQYPVYKGGYLSELEFPLFDAFGTATSEELDNAETVYIRELSSAIESVDPSLTWNPSDGTVYGVKDMTNEDALPNEDDFREWFYEQSEKALELAWDEIKS